MKVRPYRKMKQKSPAEKCVLYKGFELTPFHLRRLLAIRKMRRKLDRNMQIPAMGKFTH